MWIVVYLNRDPFAVKRADYLRMVEAANGDWIKVSEWVELHGVYLNQKHQPLLPFQQ